jgi:hypothetical protein
MLERQTLKQPFAKQKRFYQEGSSDNKIRPIDKYQLRASRCSHLPSVARCAGALRWKDFIGYLKRGRRASNDGVKGPVVRHVHVPGPSIEPTVIGDNRNAVHRLLCEKSFRKFK